MVRRGFRLESADKREIENDLYDRIGGAYAETRRPDPRSRG
jgi:hypothetical protein